MVAWVVRIYVFGCSDPCLMYRIRGIVALWGEWHWALCELEAHTAGAGRSSSSRFTMAVPVTHGMPVTTCMYTTVR